MKNKIPKLRFKEFSGEWENLKIKEISSLKGGFAFKSNNFLAEKSNYQVIKMGNLYQNKLLLDRNPSFLENITLKEKEYLLEKGDILITLTGTVGKRDFGYSYQINNEKNLLLNQRLALIKSKQGVSSNKFLKYIVLKNQFLDQFFEASAGGTGNQANVSIKNIEDFIVILPSLQEQEKIANFLSSVDTKIEMLEKKKELLSDYKKGMMQKLFSQKLRFKDENRNDYPEWEEKKLGEITTFHQQGYYTKDSYHINNPYYLLSGSNIKNHRISLDNCPKINATDKDYATFKVSSGDILLVRSGNVGDYAIIYDEQNIIFGSYLIKFNFDNNILLNEFFGCFYQSNIKEKQLKRIIQSSANININAENIKNLKISLPSLQEQEKIANFLSSIDKKIELVEGELEKNKEFKKGLLQQMFV